MLAIYLIIGVGWILFWTYWIIKAAGSKRNILHRGRLFIAIRFAILVLVLLAIKSGPKGWRVGHQNLILGLVGLAFWALGLALAIWARVYLGKNWGMPMNHKADAELVTSGPYHFIRHPIYSGILLAALGTALATTWLWFIVFIAFAVYFIPSAVIEERDMAKQFPKAYAAYKRHSKMLIPFVF